jgi:hypothetical protein
MKSLKLAVSIFVVGFSTLNIATKANEKTPLNVSSYERKTELAAATHPIETNCPTNSTIKRVCAVTHFALLQSIPIIMDAVATRVFALDVDNFTFDAILRRKSFAHIASYNI